MRLWQRQRLTRYLSLDHRNWLVLVQMQSLRSDELWVDWFRSSDRLLRFLVGSDLIDVFTLGLEAGYLIHEYDTSDFYLLRTFLLLTAQLFAPSCFLRRQLRFIVFFGQAFHRAFTALESGRFQHGHLGC